MFKSKRRQRYSLSVRGVDMFLKIRFLFDSGSMIEQSNHPQKIRTTLALITDNWDDCANSDIDVRVTIHKGKLSNRITNAILILYTMTIIMYCFGVIMAGANVLSTDVHRSNDCLSSTNWKFLSELIHSACISLY